MESYYFYEIDNITNNIQNQVYVEIFLLILILTVQETVTEEGRECYWDSLNSHISWASSKAVV